MESKQTTTPARSDRLVGAVAVAVCSIVLALILAAFGYRTWEVNDGPCKAAAFTSGASEANIPACSRQRFAIYFYVAAFAVAGGGLKLAQRLGRK